MLTGACGDEIPRRYAYGAQRIADYATLLGEIVEAPERLINSRSGRIHLFPAVPDWTTCAFDGLRARGGFEDSAAMKDGAVEGEVRVRAARSVPCRVVDEETGEAVESVIDRGNGECIEFQTRGGKTSP